MRSVGYRLLAAALVMAVALPAMAQRRPGGFGGFRGGSLITNKSVQEELKLTDAQKEKLEASNKALGEKMRGLFQPGGDREKAREAFQAIAKEREKAQSEILTAAQQKRLKQITLQQRGAQALTDPEVQKALKLSDKQVSEIKGTVEDITKDSEAALREAGRDFAKQREIREKVRKMTDESLAKIVDGFSAEQKSAWKDMAGEKFEVKFEPRQPGTGRPGQPGTGRPGQGRPGQGRPGQGRPGAPRPGAERPPV